MGSAFEGLTEQGTRKESLKRTLPSRNPRSGVNRTLTGSLIETFLGSRLAALHRMILRLGLEASQWSCRKVL